MMKMRKRKVLKYEEDDGEIRFLNINKNNNLTSSLEKRKLHPLRTRLIKTLVAIKGVGKHKTP